MAKLAAKTHSTQQLSPSTHADTLNLLAGEIRRAIISQCLPKLCPPCRRVLMERRVSAPPYTSFCTKCSKVISMLVHSKKAPERHDSESITGRFMSFMQSVYSGLCSSPVKTGANTDQKSVVRPLIRNRIDSSSIYPYLTALNRPWCRYCGVTVSSKWKSGPWGKTSLCNSHGPDDSGCEQFDFNSFVAEGNQRIKPILSDYCIGCWKCVSATSPSKNMQCSGCSLSIHSICSAHILPSSQYLDEKWFCSPECISDHKKRIVRGKLGFHEKMPFTIIINPTALSPEPFRKHPEPLIFVPKFAKVLPVQPKLKRSANDVVEAELSNLVEAHCSKRHYKYEITEKNNHLLRPHILKRLFPKKAAK